MFLQSVKENCLIDTVECGQQRKNLFGQVAPKSQRIQLISIFHNRFREVVREQFSKIGKRIHSFKL